MIYDDTVHNYSLDWCIYIQNLFCHNRHFLEFSERIYTGERGEHYVSCMAKVEIEGWHRLEAEHGQRRNVRNYIHRRQEIRLAGNH